jgi:hypothetical protein
MAIRFASVVVLFGLLLVPAASPFTATAQAQVSASCSNEIGKLEAAQRQYNADATKAGVGFITDEVGNAALSGIKKDLAGDPSAAALADMEQKYQEYRESVERGLNYKAVFARLAQCLTTGKSGCLWEITAQSLETSRLSRRVHDALNDWIKSLGNDPISKAVERVEKARSIAENMAQSAGNMAMDAANGALKNCFNDMKQRVEAEKKLVDLRTNLPKSPTGTEKGGGKEGKSVGKAIVVTSVLAAGTAAALVSIPQLVDSASGPDCSAQKAVMDGALSSLQNAVNNLSLCGSDIGCLTSRQGALTSATSAIANSGGNYCACLGVGSQASAAERAEFQALAAAAKVSPGNFPACMR